ncbi:MAG: (2Fe-2S)-binding protein [Deltaproteobacteria bacterium]
MVVCLCQGISEKRVRAAIRTGASTRKQVTKACRAGGGCGGCHEVIKDLIRDEQATAPRSPERASGDVAGQAPLIAVPG